MSKRLFRRARRRQALFRNDLDRQAAKPLSHLYNQTAATCRKAETHVPPRAQCWIRWMKTLPQRRFL